MPIDFTFRSVSPRSLDTLTKFITQQDLGYPNYQAWTEKTRGEIQAGYKQAYIMYYYGTVAGDVIFQKHKQDERLIELKNIRIHPKVRGRNCARFMLKQVELEMPYEAIIVDARTSQTDIISLLSNLGYLPVAKLSLYNQHDEDLVMIKFKEQSQKEKIINSVKSNLNL